MCTKFGVDSSSRFLLRARTNRQTNRQTRLNALPTPAAIQPAWVITIIIYRTKDAHLRFNVRFPGERGLSSRPSFSSSTCSFREPQWKSGMGLSPILSLKHQCIALQKLKPLTPVMKSPTRLPPSSSTTAVWIPQRKHDAPCVCLLSNISTPSETSLAQRRAWPPQEKLAPWAGLWPGFFLMYPSLCAPSPKTLFAPPPTCQTLAPVLH